MNEDKIINRAIAALCRRCEREGTVFDQPSRSRSYIEDEQVFLRNNSRELAVFRIVNGGRIRYIHPQTQSEIEQSLRHQLRKGIAASLRKIRISRMPSKRRNAVLTTALG